MKENEGGAVGLPGVRRMGNKIVAPSFASARLLCPAALTVSDGPEAPHAAPPPRQDLHYAVRGAAGPPRPVLAEKQRQGRLIS